MLMPELRLKPLNLLYLHKLGQEGGLEKLF